MDRQERRRSDYYGNASRPPVPPPPRSHGRYSDSYRPHGGNFQRDNNNNNNSDNFHGGGGYNNPRKRRFDDSFAPHGHNMGGMPPHMGVSPLTEMKRRVLRLGERDVLVEHDGHIILPAVVSARTIVDRAEDDVKELCEAILRETHARDAILSWIVKCVCGLPLKTMQYAGLIALINATSPPSGHTLLTSLFDALQVAFTAKNFDRAKLLLRCFCELCNCETVDSTDLMRDLDQLLEIVENESCPLVRRESFAAMLLSLIPWLAGTIKRNSTVRSRVGTILNSLERFVSSREPADSASQQTVPPHVLEHHPFGKNANKELRDEGEADDEHPDDDGGADVLAVWCRRVKRGFAKDFRMRHGADLVIGSLAENLQKQLSSARQFRLPLLDIRAHVVGTQYPSLGATFLPLFPQSVNTDKHGNDFYDLDELVVQELVDDTLVAFGDNAKMCANELATMFCRCPRITLQVLFARMLELPCSRSPLVFYAATLLELCRLDRDIHPLLGKAINQLWQRRPELDEEAADRFVEWFAVHISNTDFKWPWKVWGSVTTQDPFSPQYSTTRDMFARLVRLSSLDRVTKTVPENFLSLLPEKPVPLFDFVKTEDEEVTRTAKHKNNRVSQSDISAGVPLATTLLEKFKSKASSDEVLSVVNSFSFEGDDAHDSDDDNASPEHNRWKRSEADTLELKREVFGQVLFNFGSDSFSHISNAIERYSDALYQLFETTTHRVQLLRILATVWQNYEFMVLIVVDKLLTCRVVDPNAVVDWAFCKENSPKLIENWIWEVLYRTIDRTLLRGKTIQEEVDNLVATNALSKAPNSPHRDHHHSDDDNRMRTDEEDRRKNDDDDDNKSNHSSTRGDAHSKPTGGEDADEQLNQKKSELDACLKEQKKMFLVVFQHFSVALTEHLSTNFDDGKLAARWFDVVCGRLLQTGRKYHREIASLVPFLEQFLFVKTLDKRIVGTFRRIQCVVSYHNTNAVARATSTTQN